MARLRPLRLVRGTHVVPSELRGAIVTVGAFDGMHLGHRALIDRTVEWARAEGRAALMLTFEPMPREFLQPDSPPARLTNFRERWRLLESTGLDALVLLRFDRHLHHHQLYALESTLVAQACDELDLELATV